MDKKKNFSTFSYKLVQMSPIMILVNSGAFLSISSWFCKLTELIFVMIPYISSTGYPPKTQGIMGHVQVANKTKVDQCRFSHDVTNSNYLQIDVSFSCVCPVIDHKFRHHIVKVAVQFTHSISQTQIPFLDSTLSISGSTISTSVYYKDTDTHNYLHYTSSHPKHCKNGIYSIFPVLAPPPSLL